MASVLRSVSIRPEQDRFLKQRSISASKLLQRAIKQEMEDYAFARTTEVALAEVERGESLHIPSEEFDNMTYEEFEKRLRKWKSNSI